MFEKMNQKKHPNRKLTVLEPLKIIELVNPTLFNFVLLCFINKLCFMIIIKTKGPMTMTRRLF